MCVNRTETVHETLRHPVFISPIVWNMCEYLHYGSVYFKELHNCNGGVLQKTSHITPKVVARVSSYIYQVA